MREYLEKIFISVQKDILNVKINLETIFKYY